MKQTERNYEIRIEGEGTGNYMTAPEMLALIDQAGSWDEEIAGDATAVDLLTSLVWALDLEEKVEAAAETYGDVQSLVEDALQ